MAINVIAQCRELKIGNNLDVGSNTKMEKVQMI